MGNIEKIRDDLYVKKGWDGYRVVYPTKKDPSKPLFSGNNINWKNFLFGGHWSYPIKMLLFLAALWFFIRMYRSDVGMCMDFIKNIDYNCRAYLSTTIPIVNNSLNSIGINFSGVFSNGTAP